MTLWEAKDVIFFFNCAEGLRGHPPNKAWHLFTNAYLAISSKWCFAHVFIICPKGLKYKIGLLCIDL